MINKVAVAELSELDDNDAVNACLKNKEELLSSMKQEYGEILPEELVSIYYIKAPNQKNEKE